MSSVLRGLALLVFIAGCAATTALPQPATGRDPASARAAFERGEDEVLRELAAIDARLARRSRLVPREEDLRRVVMTATLREDPSVALVDGAIDPFSFDARARGLDAAKQKLAALPPAGLERDLLVRLVDAELVRLDEERALPRSSSALVRAIVDTWQTPRSIEEAGDEDRWLARRLGEIRGSLGATPPLDVTRARELDDALDALERLATGFTKATQELVRIREALEALGARPPARPAADWELVSRRARAHLGISLEGLGGELIALEADTRARAERAMTDAHVGRDVLDARLPKEIFAAGPCNDAVFDSRVRSMAAPEEREAGCHLRHLVAVADDDAAQAIALVVMHDHVVVATRALDVARGSSLAEAEARHRLIAPVMPDRRARLERIALARPVSAIGAALTVSILVDGEPRMRARAWLRVGEVPLDVARTELAAAAPPKR